MSITAETAKAHAKDPAVLCCRAEEGITIEAANLEDPAIFDDLVDSGLLNLEGVLTIEQVLGAKLKKTCDSLTALTPDVVEGYKEVAAEESCVIIGRCADFILKDNPNVIRLFFYAPREDCITRVKTQNGGKEKDIIRKIEKTDKYRSDYYKYHTGKDWNDSRNYDFCLNTASMSYEKLVAVVKAYIEQYA